MTVIYPRFDQTSASGFDDLDGLLCVQRRLKFKSGRNETEMTSAQVVETSVTNNSSSQNYTHSDDHTIRTTDIPGFKPFTKFVLREPKRQLINFDRTEFVRFPKTRHTCMDHPVARLLSLCCSHIF